MGLNKWVVKKVVPCRDYTLLITFANGKQKVFDVKPLLEAKINEPLKDMDFFMQARVLGPSVGWNDELDICPEYLYEKGIPVKEFSS